MVWFRFSKRIIIDNIMNELDEDQIAILMKPTPFNGCFTKDDLDIIPQGCTCINLNGQSHWTGLYRDGNHYFYFDSFATPPPLHLENLMKVYQYNTKDIQAINSSSCGYYCVAFLKWMYQAKQKYKAFEDFIDLFTNEYNKNEVVLHELLK